MARLASDLDMSQTKKIFEILRIDTNIFNGCN